MGRLSPEKGWRSPGGEGTVRFANEPKPSSTQETAGATPGLGAAGHHD